LSLCVVASSSGATKLTNRCRANALEDMKEALDECSFFFAFLLSQGHRNFFCPLTWSCKRIGAIYIYIITLN
jgi:hypothetical protein